MNDDIEYDDLGEHPQQQESDEERPVSFGRWLGELLLMVLLALILSQGIRAFIVEPRLIPSGSMEPTLAIKDRVLVNKFVYRFEDPEPGEIVILKDPTDTVPIIIKRVVAVEGQTVDLQNGQVLIDGTPIDEPYTHGKASEPIDPTIQFPYTVPEDSVWLMGDNRTNSTDSRVFGAVPLSEIRGQAFCIYWPVDRWQGL